MAKLNTPGYKGGSTQSSRSQLSTISPDQKRQEDIRGFVNSIQNKYYNNILSKEDIEVFIQCLNEIKQNSPISTYPTSDILHKMTDFTKNMFKQNVVNISHIELMVGLLSDVVSLISPKDVLPPTPPISDGSISTLSQGYKK